MDVPKANHKSALRWFAVFYGAGIFSLMISGWAFLVSIVGGDATSHPLSIAFFSAIAGLALIALAIIGRLIVEMASTAREPQSKQLRS